MYSFVAMMNIDVHYTILIIMIVRVFFAFFLKAIPFYPFLVQNTLVSNLLYTSFSDLSFAVWSKPKQTKQINTNYIKLLHL